MRNVQRSTLNVQRSMKGIGRWKLNVGRWMLILLILVGGLNCNRPAQHETRKTITLWYPWGADLGKQLKQIVGEFEKTHPGIHVELSFASNNLTSSQKLFLAIAAGVA